MQGVLTFFTMACAAAFQAPFVSGIWGAFQDQPPDCLMTNLNQARGPTLTQRLADAGVPEVHELFGLHVADTPPALLHNYPSPAPRQDGLKVKIP